MHGAFEKLLFAPNMQSRIGSGDDVGDTDRDGVGVIDGDGVSVADFVTEGDNDSDVVVEGTRRYPRRQERRVRQRAHDGRVNACDSDGGSGNGDDVASHGICSTANIQWPEDGTSDTTGSVCHATTCQPASAAQPHIPAALHGWDGDDDTDEFRVYDAVGPLPTQSRAKHRPYCTLSM